MECWIKKTKIGMLARTGRAGGHNDGCRPPLRYAIIIEEVFGLDKIEFLQSHKSMEIYQEAFDIIGHYFGTEEEDMRPFQ